MIPPLLLPLSQIQWSAVFIATMASFVGLVIMTNLFEVTRSISPSRRTLPDILVPTITALALWGAAFSTIQSHVDAEDISYSAPIAAFSLLIVVGAFIAAYLLAAKAYSSRKFVLPVTAGILLVTSSICAMYFCLIAAIRIPGIHLAWSISDIAMTISLPLMVALASPFIRLGRAWQRILVVGALGAASTLWLHYHSISAVILSPADTLTTTGLSAHFLGQTVIMVFSVLVLVLTLISGSHLRFQSSFIRNLEASIEAMPVGLAFYDKKDRLMLWNRHYANLNPAKSSKLEVGMSYQQVLEAGVKDAVVPATERQDRSWAIEHSKNRDEGDWLLPYTSGKGWIQVQSRRTQNGGIVTTVADLTTQMQNRIALENKLADANSANLAKSRFLANMSHEIRTPLNGVMAVADTLSRTQLTLQQTEMVNLIHQSSRTLQILLTEILDLARVETGHLTLNLEPVNMEAVVNEVIQLHAAAAHSKDISFDVSLSPQARAWVNADPVRLKQILGNILSNAVKFTSEGHIHMTVTADGNLFQFIISDTGIGFPADFKPRLFDRFEQADSDINRRYEGSGLGLAICYELVTMMKGTIDAESTQGVGSTFSIVLPLERVASPVPQHTAAAPTNPPEDTDEQGLRILLADDNPTNRRVVQLIMEATRARMSEATNGQEALEAYRKAPFDLILMDMQMPVMDGISAVQAIRKHEKETGQTPTPIIMLTANAMPEHVTSSLDAGADAHLAKPFNVTQLLELTHRLTVKAA